MRAGLRRRTRFGLPPHDDAFKWSHCGRPARPKHLPVNGFIEAVLHIMRAQAPLYADVTHIVIYDAGARKLQPDMARESSARQPKPVEVICMDHGRCSSAVYCLLVR